MKRILVFLMIMVLSCLLFLGCFTDSDSEKALKDDAKIQGEVLVRAQTVAPAYQINNFLSNSLFGRNSLVEIFLYSIKSNGLLNSNLLG